MIAPDLRPQAVCLLRALQDGPRVIGPRSRDYAIARSLWIDHGLLTTLGMRTRSGARRFTLSSSGRAWLASEGRAA